MALINNVIYVDGVKAVEPASLDQTLESLRPSGGVAWIALHRPDQGEMETLASEFGLHPLAVEDAVRAHQRSKVEQYGDVTFIVLRPARIEAGRVRVGELHLFIGSDFVVSVRQDDFPDVAGVRRRMEARPEELGLGPMAILYAILDELVDEYAPVLAHLTEAVDEVEESILAQDQATSIRVYELMRDVLLLQRAVHPVAAFVEQIMSDTIDGPANDQLKTHFRDVWDHALRATNQLDAFRDLLASGLQLHIALVGQRQNEEMARMTETALQQTVQSKKVSAWAAILFTPTVIAGIYGMNFTHMPELQWVAGYPFALGLMLSAAIILYVLFKRQHWL